MCYRILEILQWVRVTSFFIFRIFFLFIRSREFYYKRFIFRSLIPISVRFAVILIKIIGIVNTLILYTPMERFIFRIRDMLKYEG